MEKIRNKYIRVWVILFALFNVVSLGGTGLIRGFDAMDVSFCLGLGALELSLIAQLVFALRGYRGGTQRYYRGRPLIRTSYLGLLLTAAAGAVCMLLLPGWSGVILGMGLMVFECFALLNSSAGEAREGSGKKETEAAFLPALAEKAEKLLSEAPNEAVKSGAEKILEALKMANPDQSPALAGIEAKIAAAFAAFTAADDKTAPAAADRVVSLLRDRNNNCKLLK